MRNCAHCQTELYTDNIPSGRDFRCAVCGGLNSVKLAVGKTASQRAAWWSFGLASFLCLSLVGIVFLFVRGPNPWLLLGCLVVVFAGMTAVYKGIRAMLQMRYQNVTRLTKLAAGFGVVVGGIFGVLFGGMFLVFGLLAFVLNQMSETAENPEASYVLYERMMHFDFPDDSKIIPYRANLTANIFGRVNFRNHEASESSHIWIQALRLPKWTTANRAQFIDILHKEVAGEFGRSSVSQQSKQKLSWQIAGKSTDVTRVDWVRTIEKEGSAIESEIVQYYSLFDVDVMTFGIVLMHDPAASGFTEDDIRGIFESFRRTD